MSKVKFWTVQKRSVYETINEMGIYYPDFRLSDSFSDIQDLDQIYDFFLQSFNRNNDCDYDGLVFTFAGVVGDTIYIPGTYEVFKEMMIGSVHAVSSCWSRLIASDSVVLCVEKEMNFNPIFIDYNDYSFIIPPVEILPPYTEEDTHRIFDIVCNGLVKQSIFSSNLMQCHIPYIAKEEVVGVYPTFTLEEKN